MRSMTGYSSGMRTTEKYDVFIELKSVNSRYFEYKLRSSFFLGDLELDIRNLIFKYLQRGKVDINIRVVEKNAENYVVVVNRELAKKYETALKEIAQNIKIVPELNIRDFLQLDGVLTLERIETDKQLNKTILELLKSLVLQMIDMMDKEGEKTRLDILKSLDLITQCTDKIDKVYPESLEKYKQLLKERILELKVSDIDEHRLMMEIEIVASRTAINEELVRLKSHLEQFSNILNSKIKGDARTLDFIAQEMHREVNTIAAKSSNYEIIQNTIVIKGEIEKIREQLRNLV